MTSSKTNYPKKRLIKNFFINPSYQLRYVLWVAAIALVLISLNGAVFYHYISENYSVLVDMSPMTAQAKEQLYSELQRIIVLLVTFNGGFVILASMVGLFISHRTAGPLYHFNRVFKAIGQGDLNARIKLRPRDDFKDVAQSFNEMMDKISTRK